MKDEKITVQLAGKERHFTRCYLDFIDCDLLTGEEKILFLILKRFMDIRTDQGEVYPSIKTIQNLTRWGRDKIFRVMKSLQDKGVLTIQRRGQGKNNLYVIKDRAEMWKAGTVEELQAAAEETKEEQAIRYLRSIGYTEFKKGNAPKPNAQPTKAADGLGANKNNLTNYPTGKYPKSQDVKNNCNKESKKSLYRGMERDYQQGFYDSLENMLSEKKD